jgi:hypothetical protein
MCRNESNVVEIKLDTTYRKYQEFARTLLIARPISQSSPEVSPPAFS